MSVRAQPSLFPSFAGIALADILANSVAIIIILIVITIAVKHTQERERLAEVEDVSVLLSRDLATSVVMNGLPTSAPARLHDYHNSPLDRVLDPRVMPIIELHTDFVRDYYSKLVFTRDELLKQENAFDHFLAAMTPQQKARIRVDIYDVRMFYVAMSIIREHNGRLPGHWHFLGYDGAAPALDPERIAKGSAQVEEAEPQPYGEPGEALPSERGDAHGGKAWEAFPQDTDLSDEQQSEPYPFDDLAWDDSETPGEEYSDLPGGAEQSELSRRSDAMFGALSKLMGQALSGGQEEQAPEFIRFRTPVPSQSKSAEGKNREVIQTMQGNGNARIDYVKLLAALFGFMQKAQTDADNGLHSALADFDFQRDVLEPAAMMPPPRDPQQTAFLTQLAKHVQRVASGGLLEVSQAVTSALAGNQLQLAINRPLDKAVLAGDEHQETLDFLPGEAEVTSRLGLYPAIYKGLQAPIKKTSLVLMPSEQNDPQAWRWRVATVVSPERDDYLIAFLWSAFADDGSLLLPTDENGIRVNQASWITYRPPVLLRKERETFFAYGIAAILLLLGLLHRFGRLPRSAATRQ